ncbi:MAG: hypothetical protein ACRD6W_18100 [Nitrososphaerales archaeon]
MRDIEFYAQLLGLEEPWYVEDVELSVADKRIDIAVSHHEGHLWPCPKCETELPVYDHERCGPGGISTPVDCPRT